ncbi:MAG: type II toxin-antitoxin system HicB family antitoxin [Gemmatimonadaceae bacterium]
MTKNFLVIIEPTGTGFSAYSPDVPGCVAAGKTRAATEKRMREAIEMHIEGLREDGLAVPEPQSIAAYVSVAA